MFTWETTLLIAPFGLGQSGWIPNFSDENSPSAGSLLCPASTCLRIGSKFRCMRAKHSKSFSLIDCISVGVDRLHTADLVGVS
jgi:hypothetical protein